MKKPLKETFMKSRFRARGPLSAVAGALLCAGAVQAQQGSSLQMYGLINTGVEYLKSSGDGGSLTRMPSNTNTAPSRLGFRGSENLGDGLSAVFTLEMGIDPGTGTLNQGGRAFGRQAFVGLKGGLGTVTLGRIYTMTFWNGLNADTLGGGIYGTGSLDPYLPNARVDNAVGWMYNQSGWTLGANYSLGRDTVNAGPSPAGTNCPGEASNDSQACRQWSLMAKYDASTWGVGLSNDRQYGRDLGPPPDAIFGGLNSSSKSDNRLYVNGWFMLGQTKIGAGVINRDNDGLPARSESNMWYLGAQHPITPLFTLAAQWVGMRYSDDSSYNANLVAVRGTYSFSKRTNVFAQVGYIQNSDNSNVSVSGGAPGSNPGRGNNQTGLNFGISHSF